MFTTKQSIIIAGVFGSACILAVVIALTVTLLGNESDSITTAQNKKLLSNATSKTPYSRNKSDVEGSALNHEDMQNAEQKNNKVKKRIKSKQPSAPKAHPSIKPPIINVKPLHSPNDPPFLGNVGRNSTSNQSAAVSSSNMQLDIVSNAFSKQSLLKTSSHLGLMSIPRLSQNVELPKHTVRINVVPFSILPVTKRERALNLNIGVNQVSIRDINVNPVFPMVQKYSTERNLSRNQEIVIGKQSVNALISSTCQSYKLRGKTSSLSVEFKKLAFEMVLPSAIIKPSTQSNMSLLMDKTVTDKLKPYLRNDPESLALSMVFKDVLTNVGNGEIINPGQTYSRLITSSNLGSVLERVLKIHTKTGNIFSAAAIAGARVDISMSKSGELSFKLEVVTMAKEDRQKQLENSQQNLRFSSGDPDESQNDSHATNIAITHLLLKNTDLPELIENGRCISNCGEIGNDSTDPKYPGLQAGQNYQRRMIDYDGSYLSVYEKSSQFSRESIDSTILELFNVYEKSDDQSKYIDDSDKMRPRVQILNDDANYTESEDGDTALQTLNRIEQSVVSMDIVFNEELYVLDVQDAVEGENIVDVVIEPSIMAKIPELAKSPGFIDEIKSNGMIAGALTIAAYIVLQLL